MCAEHWKEPEPCATESLPDNPAPSASRGLSLDALPCHVQGWLGLVNGAHRAVSPVDVSRDLPGARLPPALAGRATPCDPAGALGHRQEPLGAQGNIGRGAPFCLHVGVLASPCTSHLMGGEPVLQSL